MTGDLCFTGEYEPESYQEMLDSLNNMRKEKAKIEYGFRPSEFTVAYYLNTLYSEDIDHCPFCRCDIKHEIIVVKTTDHNAAQGLFERLRSEKNKMEINIKNSKKYGEYHSEFYRRRRRRRALPSPQDLFLKKEHGGRTRDDRGEQYWKVTFSWNIGREIVMDGILEAISNHKDYMSSCQEEYDDYPGFKKAFSKFKGAFYDVVDGLERWGTQDDCDQLIRYIRDELKDLTEYRDEMYNEKLEVNTDGEVTGSID